MDSYQVCVIGGGILGLATAMQLTQSYPGCRVAVLEKESRLASHQTGHNSGVIHSGIYYKPGSHKARLCVEGGKLLKRFCDEHGIRYELCGKVVVATHPSELGRLDNLFQRAQANGVEGVEVIGPDRLKEIEPHAYGIKALWVPVTGIVDFKEVARAYAEVVTSNGGEILTSTRVVGISRANGLLHLETSRGAIRTQHLINCAGLYSDQVARMMGVKPPARIVPFRGEYYTLRPQSHHLVRGLIYPVPDPRFPFLGVHFTRRITGEVEAGPNAVLALAREGYTKGRINLAEFLGTLGYGGFWAMARRYWKVGIAEMHRSFSRAVFLKDLQRLVPDIKDEDLAPGGAGVRAQALGRDGSLLDDFVIEETENAVHVLNAPSPAATASLAIAKYIVGLAAKRFGLDAYAKR